MRTDARRPTRSRTKRAGPAARAGAEIGPEKWGCCRATSDGHPTALPAPTVSKRQADPSVGSVGGSYDNALAESVIGLFKTEVIRRKDPWRGLDAVEFATLEWVDWFNNRRLLEPIGNIPPAEAEASYHDANRDPAMAA